MSCDVLSNIVDIAGCGVMMNPGKLNVIENNILVDCDYQIIYQVVPQMVSVRNNYTQNQVRKNLYSTTNVSDEFYALHACTEDSVLSDSNQNLFWKSAGGNYNFWINEDANSGVWGDGGGFDVNMTTWQNTYLYDINSGIADPCFVDLRE
ncbi:MAG: hypothetical protein ABIG61_16950, partial [Planctomycetota bacterium]